MKIQIASADFGITLRLPTALAFNPVTALFMPRVMAKSGISIDRHQAAQFIKALNDYRRKHPEWALVEVEGADGNSVTVKI